jgi:alcohol dehydrogenase class IV
VRRALLVTDPGVAATGHPDRVRQSIEAEGIAVVTYDRSRVEPTIDSLQEAADFALAANVDGFVSVGGGSAMDTAKVTNLVLTHSRPVMDYVKPADRRGAQAAVAAEAPSRHPDDVRHGQRGDHRRGPRHPRLKVKTGISHRYMRPSQAIVDPS